MHLYELLACFALILVHLHVCCCCASFSIVSYRIWIWIPRTNYGDTFGSLFQLCMWTSL